jgi:hypothetical protein
MVDVISYGRFHLAAKLRPEDTPQATIEDRKVKTVTVIGDQKT